YESRITPATHGWLYDHRVGVLAVMPGAGIVELIRVAGEEYLGQPNVSVLALVLQSPLILAEAGQNIQVMIRNNDEQYEVTVWSQATRNAEWTMNATAEVINDSLATPPKLDLTTIKARCSTPKDIDEIYQQFAVSGLPYGPVFRGLQIIWSNENEVLASLKMPEEPDDLTRFGIHPVLLDLAFQAYLSIDDSDILQLPFSIERIVVYQRNYSEALAYVKVSRFGNDHQSIEADVMLTDRSGNAIASVHGMCIRLATLPDSQTDTGSVKKIYTLRWKGAGEVECGIRQGAVVAMAGLSSHNNDGLSTGLVSCGCSRVSLVDFEKIADDPPDILLLSWDTEEYDGRGSNYKDVLLTAVDTIKQLVASGITSKVVWLTRKAVRVVADDQVNPVATALLSVARAFSKEFSVIPLSVIDADDISGNNLALITEILSQHSEAEVALREGARFIPRLNVLQQDVQQAVGAARGIILITGGLGAIGLNIAHWLAELGATRIVLVSRNTILTKEKQSKIADIERYGASVSLISTDVADLASLTQMMEQIQQEGRISGIIHAAGSRNAQLLHEVTSSSFSEVMAAKVDGAIYLDLLSRNLNLDFFILFSSVASTLSPEGQAMYAAANAFLDGLVDYRQSLGLTACSYAWGPWGEEGMVSGLDATQAARLKNHGIEVLTTADASQLFRTAATCTAGNLILADLNVRAVKNYFREDIPVFWRDLIPAGTTAKKLAKAGVLAPVPEAERYSQILTLICAESARVLSLARTSDIDKNQSLRDKGLDSLMGLELRKALGKKVGITLPATLALDHPTPCAMADFILNQLASEEHKSSSVAETVMTFTSEPTGKQMPHKDVVLVPLSLGQERLWFMDKLGENKSLYNMHYGIRISSKLDIQRLHDCLALLVARHEALRTTFIDVPLYGAGQEMPRALIAPQGRVPLDVADLRGQPDALRQAGRLAY
ncbi:SDR family NAD(P)-dependent oxidoreductase, partial [Salmonella enterica]|nr:SDR family NAD(P)-dependent oxidoreductase [Salmonella enterica]